MRDVRQRSELALEPVERRGIATANRLHRDGHLAGEVVGLVDDAHAAVADAPGDGKTFCALERIERGVWHLSLDAMWTRNAAGHRVGTGAAEQPSRSGHT